MNTYTLFTFAVALTLASAAVVLQGPSRKTTLVGPEGSVISSVAPGGQVITEEHPGVVAHAGPVPQIIAAVIVDPEVSGGVPYGSAGVPYGPAAPLVAAQQVPPLVHTLAAAIGVGEGQYVPDQAEALYDDGSYKPHLH